MLGDLILEHTGRVTSNKVLDSKKSKMENSIIANGKTKGIDISINITYWNIQCAGGLSYGEGKGEITPQAGDTPYIVKVTEYGVGKSHGQKTMWRGSAFYQTSLSNNKLSFLHGMVGVFETEVNEESGNVTEKVWEWK
ncbi:MAG TPA: hypothetical protein VIP70_06685 [Nitrososphaeraceae archaeon]|jgi:hypothetical protein